MLQVRELRKRFGKLVALDGVTFGAAAGETVGLLGPNGAGKTTAVSIIAGLLKPDSGEVLVNGRMLRGDTDPAKRGIGLVPQDIGLFEEISARENLALFAALYGLGGVQRRKAVDEALDFVGLTDRAKDMWRDSAAA
jgi:ABC-2 type transport system ATP-binding protein